MSNNSRVAIATLLTVTGSAALLYSLYRLFKDTGQTPEPSKRAGEPSETDSGPVVSNLTKYGKPSILQELKKPGYHVLYNSRTRTPVYVVEKLTGESLVEVVGIDREGINFRSEDGIKMRSSNADYLGSGFDRGHMAAAANHASNEDALIETFTLGNAVPQFPACNRGNWKTLENHARAVAKTGAVVYVYSGPLYIPQHTLKSDEKYVIFRVIGNNTVAVPTHFFKILVSEQGKQVGVTCYLAENAPTGEHKAVEDMRVGLGDIERWSGLVFEKLHRFQ